MLCRFKLKFLLYLISRLSKASVNSSSAFRYFSVALGKALLRAFSYKAFIS